jgi:hypothetical protein
MAIRPPPVVVAALVALVVAVVVTPSHASEKWGPFRGQLVDQATGKGIQGAAVVAVWWKNEPNPIQMNRSFFDAIEAVTDADGRFEIPFYPNPPFFSFQIFPAEVSYFAPGYIPIREEVIPADGRVFVAPTKVLMERLDSREALLRKSRSGPAGVPPDKMKEFAKAVNIERVMVGLSPAPLPGMGIKP